MTGKPNIVQITIEPLLVGAAEAARLLGIGRRLLWSMSIDGRIPSVRLGRRRLYDPDDLRTGIRTAKTRGGAR